METGLTVQQITAEITRSPHGKYDEYVPVCRPAAAQDPEFFAHFCSWNADKGEVRDATVAFPVLALTAPNLAPECADNALAHMASLAPREFAKAVSFARRLRVGERRMKILTQRYLREREAHPKRLERSLLQHRVVLQRLYALSWLQPTPLAKAVLFGPGKGDNAAEWAIPAGSVFAVVQQLRTMAPDAAAAAILKHDIPFLVCDGALGTRLKEPDVVLALIKRMSPVDFVNRTKMLEKFGVRKDPVLRAAYEQALGRAGAMTTRRRGGTLKATKAAEVLERDVVADDEVDVKAVLAKKLRGLQEVQIEKTLSIAGDWLVLVDKSGSMQQAIDTGRQAAAILARAGAGRVFLVFFDSSPYFIEVTGKTYEEIKAMTAKVSAGGNTSIGCGLDYILQRKLLVDGIAIVSDGGENSAPAFVSVYDEYAKRFDRRPTVYFYRTAGDLDRLTDNCRRGNVTLTTFDLGRSVDQYSLPNLVTTMRVSRYSLLDEIRACPLLTLNDVLPQTVGYSMNGGRRVGYSERVAQG